MSISTLAIPPLLSWCVGCSCSAVGSVRRKSIRGSDLGLFRGVCQFKFNSSESMFCFLLLQSPPPLIALLGVPCVASAVWFSLLTQPLRFKMIKRSGLPFAGLHGPARASVTTAAFHIGPACRSSSVAFPLAVNCLKAQGAVLLWSPMPAMASNNKQRRLPLTLRGFGSCQGPLVNSYGPTLMLAMFTLIALSFLIMVAIYTRNRVCTEALSQRCMTLRTAVP